MNNTLQLLSLALISVSTLCPAPYEFSHDGLTITLTPAWQQIGHGKARANTFGGAWMCVGIITIKKRVNETLFLTEAVFHWHGAPFKNLHASLYRKNSEPFLAIEENVVSDGVWKASQQLLSFSFNNKQILDPVTTFYLVLTVPTSLEEPLKSGTFELLAARLPEHIRLYLGNKPLSLALSDLALHTNTKLAQHTK